MTFALTPFLMAYLAGGIALCLFGIIGGWGATRLLDWLDRE